MTARIAWIAMLLGMGGACATPSVNQGASFEPIKHPTHYTSFWQNQPVFRAKGLSAKIAEPPAELVEYLVKLNELDGYPHKPVPAPSDPHFIADVKAALTELPKGVRDAAEVGLAGIFIVRELGTTALTELVYDQTMTPVKAMIVLDRDALERSANEWLSWRENTPFKKDPSIFLEAHLETRLGNNRRQAIQYILLHELGHVIAGTGKLGPSWDLPGDENLDPTRFPYSRISWKRGPQGYFTSQDPAFPLRAKVKYYREEEKRLPAAEMVAAYDSLSSSDFPTLYAATSPHDDFAEAFANYVHVVVMRKPYEIRITQGGKIVRKLGACWSDRRCAGKRASLESILNILSI